MHPTTPMDRYGELDCTYTTKVANITSHVPNVTP
jgi:hypothetical protein